MLDRLTRLFKPENPRRNAEKAFSRLINQSTLDSLLYREGLAESRRQSTGQTNAVGVLVMERRITLNDRPDFENPFPAVSIDFRQLGIGILLRSRIEGPTVIVAIPDKEDVWRLFECEVRHQSRRPGGWFQVGLRIFAIYQPTDMEMAEFRIHASSQEPQHTAPTQQDWS